MFWFVVGCDLTGALHVSRVSVVANAAAVAVVASLVAWIFLRCCVTQLGRVIGSKSRSKFLGRVTGSR